MLVEFERAFGAERRCSVAIKRRKNERKDDREKIAVIEDVDSMLTEITSSEVEKVMNF
jgi:hypothetical protein